MKEVWGGWESTSLLLTSGADEDFLADKKQVKFPAPVTPPKPCSATSAASSPGPTSQGDPAQGDASGAGPGTIEGCP